MPPKPLESWFVNSPTLAEKDLYRDCLQWLRLQCKQQSNITTSALWTFGCHGLLNKTSTEIGKQCADKVKWGRQLKENPSYLSCLWLSSDQEWSKPNIGMNGYSGPYNVTSVRNNGNLRNQNENVHNTINHRNVTPYHSPRVGNDMWQVSPGFLGHAKIAVNLNQHSCNIWVNAGSRGVPPLNEKKELVSDQPKLISRCQWIVQLTFVTVGIFSVLHSCNPNSPVIPYSPCWCSSQFDQVLVRHLTVERWWQNTK